MLRLTILVFRKYLMSIGYEKNKNESESEKYVQHVMEAKVKVDIELSNRK